VSGKHSIELHDDPSNPDVVVIVDLLDGKVAGWSTAPAAHDLADRLNPDAPVAVDCRKGARKGATVAPAPARLPAREQAQLDARAAIEKAGTVDELRAAMLAYVEATRP